jgi:hypothetical protein
MCSFSPAWNRTDLKIGNHPGNILLKFNIFSLLAISLQIPPFNGIPFATVGESDSPFSQEIIHKNMYKNEKILLFGDCLPDAE